jgi:DDE family transposase
VQKKGALGPPGYDTGKKVRGKKRHIHVDTQGLLMQAIIHAADIQDPLGDSEAASLRETCDGGVLLIATLFGVYPFLLKLYADSGYTGPKFHEGWPGCAARSTSRSSSARILLSSWCYRNAGSWSAPSPG